MTAPTPDQSREIGRAVKSFSEDWYVDFKTKEIRRNPIQGWRRWLNVIWKRKYPVFALYWWAKHNWASELLIVFPFPIQSDNMPIEGFPMKYELLGGWTIPKDDLKYLTHGPLASEGLHNILVPASIGWQRIFEVIKQFAPVVSMAAGLVTLAANWSTVLALATKCHMQSVYLKGVVLQYFTVN